MNNVTKPRREEPVATHLGRPVNQKISFTLILVIRQSLIPPAHFKHTNTGQTSESWHHAAKPLSLYRVTGGPGLNSDPENLSVFSSSRHRWEGESESRSPWEGRGQICQNTGARKCESQVEPKKHLRHWGKSFSSEIILSLRFTQITHRIRELTLLILRTTDSIRCSTREGTLVWLGWPLLMAQVQKELHGMGGKASSSSLVEEREDR